MTSEHTPTSPRCKRTRVDAQESCRPRGRGECRVPFAPVASCVKVENTRVSHHGRAGFTRHSRTRMVLTAYGALSPVNRAFLPPSPAQCASIVAGLMPASRHQDHTLSPSVATIVRLSTWPRPPHPYPTFRDDREAPLLIGPGWREVLEMICPTPQAKMRATRWHDGHIA